MNLKKNFFKAIHKTQAHKMSRVRRALINPVREWTTCLLVTAVTALSLFGYLGYDFYLQYDGIDQPQAVDVSVLVYRQKDAALILEKYDARKEFFETMRSDKSHVYVTPLSSVEKSESEKTTMSSTNGSLAEPPVQQ